MIAISSATQMTVEHLRDLIITGALKPGEKLNESILANSLGLSRPPIREAFRLLEAESLVVNIPRKSTYVSEISLRDFEDTFQARAMIEGYAIDLIKIKNIKDFSSLENVLSEAEHCRIEKGADSMKVLKALKIYARFHIKIVALTDNFHIFKFYNSMLSHVWRYQFIYFSNRGSLPLFEEHDLIMKNIRMGNFDEAKKELLTHISYNYQQIIKDNGMALSA